MVRMTGSVWVIKIIVWSALVFACAMPALSSHAAYAIPSPTVRPIALGAYIVDFGLRAPNDPAAITKYARLVGRTPAVIMYYQTWGGPYRQWSDRLANNVISRGATPMITWEPWNGINPDPWYKLTRITSGEFDRYIRRWAKAARLWGHPFFLRFAHEMNGNWTPWGTAPGNRERNAPADYIAAWRHVHDIFTRLNVTNAVWVWSPNTIHPHSTPLALVYPGNRYVDWTGLSVFNWGPPKSRWGSLTSLLAPFYAALANVSSKPMIIGELGSTERGGNKAAWIRQGLLKDLPELFPRIRVVVWFDLNRRDQRDWRVNSSATSLAAWRQVVASPLFHAQGPLKEEIERPAL
jgi:Glycosyl hydrolase family 26